VDASSGSRTILSYPQGVTPPGVEQICPAWIQNSKVLFTDHTAGASGVAAAQLAHQWGVPVVMDLESLAAPELESLLACADHLIVGEAFARAVSGESDPAAMVRALLGERAACVVTAGERGCWYAERGRAAAHFPALEVKVVDTTGCGD
jgi:sugar/nucleoside kinase (ribokinase family)